MRMFQAYVVNAVSIFAMGHAFGTPGFQWTCVLGGLASGYALFLARLAGREEASS